jgi:hypothetical protein
MKGWCHLAAMICRTNKDIRISYRRGWCETKADRIIADESFPMVRPAVKTWSLRRRVPAKREGNFRTSMTGATIGGRTIAAASCRVRSRAEGWWDFCPCWGWRSVWHFVDVGPTVEGFWFGCGGSTDSSRRNRTSSRQTAIAKNWARLEWPVEHGAAWEMTAGNRLTPNRRTRTSEWIVTIRCHSTLAIHLWDSTPQSTRLGHGRGRLLTYVVFRQQARAELQIIIQVKRPPRLKPSTECRHRRRFGQLLHASDPAKLAVRVLRRWRAGCSARPGDIVIVRRGGRRLRWRRRWLMMLSAVVISRHDERQIEERWRDITMATIRAGWPCYEGLCGLGGKVAPLRRLTTEKGRVNRPNMTTGSKGKATRLSVGVFCTMRTSWKGSRTEQWIPIVHGGWYRWMVRREKLMNGRGRWREREERRAFGWRGLGWAVIRRNISKSTARKLGGLEGGWKKVKNWEGGRRGYDQLGKDGKIPVTGMAGSVVVRPGLGPVGMRSGSFCWGTRVQRWKNKPSPSHQETWLVPHAHHHLQDYR